MNASTDLHGWMEQATRRLPRAVKMAINAELTAHYEDAYADLCAEGMSEAQAHAAALACLGDAQAVAKVLQRTHYARRRYALGAVFAMLSMLMTVLSALFTSVLVINLMTLGCLVYALRAFKDVIEANIGTPSVGWAIAAIELGTLAAAIGTIISVYSSEALPVALLLSDPLIIASDARYGALSPTTPLHVVLALSVMMVGVGWVLLSDQLIEVRGRFYGLLTPVRLFTFFCGLGLLIMGSAVLLGRGDVLVSSLLFVSITSISRQVFMTLVLIRAARGRDAQPLRPT
jgi:hypothetical protein